MHRVVIDEPYEFVPPYKGRLLSRLFRLLLPGHLRKVHGVTEWDCSGVERLKESMAAGHGILLCPNHCRPSDPLAMGIINIEANCDTHSMASWHVFKQSRWQAFISRQLGAFSIYREGMDRQALNAAIEIVTKGERPLIVFPEGVISRCNDHLLSLMDGTAFIARSAAKKRAKENPDSKVVIHPVAMRYEFQGDIEETIKPVLSDIERRLSWSEKKSDDIFTRIGRIGRALLALQEMQHLGQVQQGAPYDRLESLIDTILRRHEEEWLASPQEGTVVARVKGLRSAIVPELVNKELAEEELDRRWGVLADVYVAQQMSLYPRGYLDEGSQPERIMETVERFEEDLTDKTKVHTPIKLHIEIGEPIEVGLKRPKGEADPVMVQLRDSLEGMLNAKREAVAQNRQTSRS